MTDVDNLTLDEKWREIAGYEGYEISDLGRVRCWRPRNAVAKTPTEPRFVKPTTCGKWNPYLRVRLGKHGKTLMVHRLVAQAFVEGEAPGLEVAHENGDKYDNRAENLRWKTRKENHADKFRHGTNGRRFTRDDVEAMRAARVEGKTFQQIGDMFNATPTTVRMIIVRERWDYAA